MSEEKKPNYTEEQVARLHESAPVDYAKAQLLAEELGKNVRSIIAKVKREGIEYIAKQAPEPKRKGPTKKELVEEIVTMGTFAEKAMRGLEKAPVPALQALHEFFSDYAEELELDSTN